MGSENAGSTGPGEAEVLLAAPEAPGLAAEHARLALLDEATERIGTTLDQATTCGELARFVVSRFAGRAAVEILPSEAVPAGLTLGGGPPRTRRVAVRADPAPYDGADGDNGHVPDGAWIRHLPGCPTGRCLTGGRAVTDTRAAADWPCEGGGAPLLVVPLRARGQLIGALSLHRSAEDGPFTAADTTLVQAVADRASRGIDNARRHALARDLTMELQRALLAEPGSPHANLELASRYLPLGSSAMVGGDWFEAIRLSFGRTLLVIGDVMGHGLEAAVDMNAYRSLLRYVAGTELPPHRILRQLDRVTALSDATRPATCLLALVDPVRHRVTLAAAGHLPPALLGPAGPARLLDVPTGPPLGTGLGDYRAVVHRLDPGQVLLLYTDGLVERRGEDIDMSLTRLTRLRRGLSEESLDDLLDHVLVTVPPASPDDDIALLAART
ncbi:PP2C family protein-serine/threonine phosphatase [Actinacidiphila alni]|uniref:PP2C family protein-serine/threonine phosphatase n=1 Tax=Actinacidiphila alni TaxID=380248 RepID=UPI003454780D